MAAIFFRSQCVAMIKYFQYKNVILYDSFLSCCLIISWYLYIHSWKLTMLKSGSSLKNPVPEKKWMHPIACLLRQDMGCLLWVQTYIHILPQSPQWCVQYHVILNHAVTALDCTNSWATHSLWWLNIPKYESLWMQRIRSLYNKTFLPSGHCWDYYPDTLLISLVK